MGMIAISQQKFKLDTSPLLPYFSSSSFPSSIPALQIELTAGTESGIFPSHDILVKSIEWLGNIILYSKHMNF